MGRDLGFFAVGLLAGALMATLVDRLRERREHDAESLSDRIADQLEQLEGNLQTAPAAS